MIVAKAVNMAKKMDVPILGIVENIYTQKIYWELQNIMRLANCRTLKDITIDKLIFPGRR